LQKREDFELDCGEYSMDSTPLIRATMQNDASLVRQLVWLGAPLNATACRNRTALHWASLLGHELVAEALLVGKYEGKGAMVDPLDSCDERTPLMLASMRGHAGVVRVLLAHGAKKERTAGEGQTALDFAKEGGHEAVVELLM